MINRRNLLKTTAVGLVSAAWPGTAQGQDRQSGWERGPDLPIPIQEIYATLHRGEIWVAGGLTPSGAGTVAPSDRCFVLNPEKRAWREGPRLSEPMHHPQLISLADRLYLIGGFRAADDGAWAMRDDAEILDNERWQSAPSLPVPLAETHAAVLDGKIHLAGGRTPIGTANAQWQDHADTDLHLIFDPVAGSWHEGPPLPTARNSGASASDGTGFYVLGGRTVAGGNRADVHRYEPANRQWIQLPDMPEARGGTAAGLLDGRIFVFGGEYFDANGSGGVFENVLAYSVAHASWTDHGPMPMPRHGLAAVAENGQIWCLGGAVRAGAEGTVASVGILSPLFSLQLGRI